MYKKIFNKIKNVSKKFLKPVWVCFRGLLEDPEKSLFCIRVLLGSNIGNDHPEKSKLKTMASCFFEKCFIIRPGNFTEKIVIGINCHGRKKLACS